MNVIVFDKEEIRKKRISNMYEYAINILGNAKCYENIKIDITASQLKKYLLDIYELYNSKNISKYYQKDTKFYLENLIECAKKDNRNIVTSDNLLDSLLCPLYEKRIVDTAEKNNQGKIITIKRCESNGRKYNQKLWTNRRSWNR